MAARSTMMSAQSLAANPARTAILFMALVATAMAANFGASLVLHQWGLQTGLWDLHFWAIWPGGHAPAWMPVDDSWMPMRKAYEWVSHPHQGTLYQEIFFHRHVKFQYPPSSLLVFAIPDAFHIAVTDRLLNWIGWLAVLAQAVATGALAFVASRKAGVLPNPTLRLACAIAVGLAVFTFHSVLWAFSLGQIQAWINAWFAFAALAWLAGRERTAGALTGLICLFKPQFALFLIWAALRRKWQFLSALTVVFGAGMVLSLIWFGVANHVDYLSALSFMSRHGEAYYPNSAVNGVLNRLLANDDPFTVDKQAFPPFHPLIYAISTATSLMFIAAGLLVRRKREPESGDFIAAAILFTVASPIAWTHHLGILPPAFALLGVVLLGRFRSGTPAAVLVLAYLCVALFIPPVAALASGIPSLAYALPLVGTLIVAAMLYSVGAQSRNRSHFRAI